MSGGLAALLNWIRFKGVVRLALADYRVREVLCVAAVSFLLIWLGAWLFLGWPSFSFALRFDSSCGRFGFVLAFSRSSASYSDHSSKCT